MTIRRSGFLCAVSAIAVMAAVLAGCPRRSTTGPGGPQAGVGAAAWRDDLFATAIDNLNRLEEFAPGAMLQQVVERLNQWVAFQEPPDDWAPEPLLAKLPERLAAMPELKNLDKMQFSLGDGPALQEAVWLGNVAAWARGPTLDDLARAGRLFDWTVRNIQLDPAAGPDGKPQAQPPQTPWETLLLGRGTAADRAWVFALLARQQGLDAAVLAPAGNGKTATGTAAWLVGVLIEKEVYLFEPGLGLPIPAPDGVKRPDKGPLEIQPATLRQVAGEEAILRKLDLDAEHPYPVKSADVQEVSVLIPASPEQLSKRMKLLESRMVGKQRVLLAVAPTAQARRWQDAPHVREVKLWEHPFQAILRQQTLPPELVRQRLFALLPFEVGPAGGLWKGRLLHLKGALTGENGATSCYQAARPSNADLGQGLKLLSEKYLKAGRQANPKQPAEETQMEASQRAEFDIALAARAKQDASYWLGLIAYERGNWEGAIDYFTKRTLEAAPGGPWTRGARYNLARTYEAAGQHDKAVAEYRVCARELGDSGSMIRARLLERERR